MAHRSHSSILRKWARLAPSSRLNWLPVDAILQAARTQSKAAESKLRNLLDESDLLFHPLCDPLLADAGLNRWLREDREEAYSDWLAWVLQQIGNAKDVLKLLRIDDPEILEGCCTLPLTVSREKVIAGGRLDLVVRIPQEIVVLIEVNVTSAESAQTAKQSGYSIWLQQQPEPVRRALLLITDAEDEDYHTFAPIRWADFCIDLRGMIQSFKNRLPVVKIALFIAFIGAVETNLLRLIAPQGSYSARTLFYARTATHLEEALGRHHD